MTKRMHASARLIRLTTGMCLGLAFLGIRVWAQTDNQLTIYAPDPQTYEIAFDEVELSPAKGEWAPGQQVLEVGGTRMSRRQASTAVFQTAEASREGVSFLARALESANPGTRANLVLYVAGQPRSANTRRVLTQEVGVMLREDADVRAFLERQQRYAPRQVAGLPNAFVLTAEDSLASIELANALRGAPEIAVAYPVLTQQRSFR